MYANHSDLSVKVAALIKAELVNEGQFPLDVVEVVVNNYNFEERGLGDMVAEIARVIKYVVREDLLVR